MELGLALRARSVVDLDRVAGAEHGYGRGWCDYVCEPAPRARESGAVSLSRPLPQLVADDEHRRALEQDEGAVGQLRPRQSVQTSSVRAAEDPLAVESPVDQRRRRYVDPEPLGPGRAVAVVALAPTLGAGAMSGREGHGFVVEVQKRVVMRSPLLVPAAPELERARDPEIAGMKADDVAPGMQDPAIAGPRAAQREGLDLAHRRHPITRRRPVLRSNRALFRKARRRGGCKSGSDGTRTRDLRPDRPLRASRGTTEHTGSLCSCASSGSPAEAPHG